MTVIFLLGWHYGRIPLPRASSLSQSVVLAQTEDGWLRELDLAPQQLQQIQMIYRRHRRQLTNHRQEVLQARQTLGDLLASDASSEELNQQYQRLQDLDRQMSDLRFQVMLQIRETLSPEQRQQLAEVLQLRIENARIQQPLQPISPGSSRPLLQRWLQRWRR